MIKPLNIEIITPDSEKGQEIFGKDVSDKMDSIFTMGETEDDDVSDDEAEPAGTAVPKTAPKKQEDDLASTNPLYGFAKSLYDDGLIELEEGEDLTEFTTSEFKEKIAEAIEAQSSKKTESYINNFSGAKKVFLGISDHFDSEAEAIHIAKDIDMLNTATDDAIDSDEELAESIVRKTLLSRNFSEKEVTKMIEDIKDLDKLSERAKEYAPSLRSTLASYVQRKKAETAAKNQAAAKNEEDYYKDLIATVEESEEIIPGMKLTERTRKILKEKMLKPVYTDEAGNQYNELGFKQKQYPKEFNIAIEMLNTLGLFEFDKKGNYKPDMSKISKLAESNIKTSVDKLVSDEQKLSRDAASSGSFIDDLRAAMGK